MPLLTELLMHSWSADTYVQYDLDNNVSLREQSRCERQCFVVRPGAAMDCSRQTPINRHTKSSIEYQCEHYVLHKINYTDHVVQTILENTLSCSFPSQVSRA